MASQQIEEKKESKAQGRRLTLNIALLKTDSLYGYLAPLINAQSSAAVDEAKQAIEKVLHDTQMLNSKENDLLQYGRKKDLQRLGDFAQVLLGAGNILDEAQQALVLQQQKGVKADKLLPLKQDAVRNLSNIVRWHLQHLTSALWTLWQEAEQRVEMLEGIQPPENQAMGSDSDSSTDKKIKSIAKQITVEVYNQLQEQNVGKKQLPGKKEAKSNQAGGVYLNLYLSKATFGNQTRPQIDKWLQDTIFNDVGGSIPQYDVVTKDSYLRIDFKLNSRNDRKGLKKRLKSKHGELLDKQTFSLSKVPYIKIKPQAASKKQGAGGSAKKPAGGKKQ